MAADPTLIFLSNLFNLPQNYFVFPNVILYFILPFIAAVYFWFTILDKKIRIFKRKSTVNFFIALSIAFFNSFMIRFFSPNIMVPGFVAAAFFINSGRGSWKRFLITLGIFILVSGGYVFLTNIIA